MDLSPGRAMLARSDEAGGNALLHDYRRPFWVAAAFPGGRLQACPTSSGSLSIRANSALTRILSRQTRFESLPSFLPSRSRLIRTGYQRTFKLDSFRHLDQLPSTKRNTEAVDCQRKDQNQGQRYGSHVPRGGVEGVGQGLEDAAHSVHSNRC